MKSNCFDKKTVNQIFNLSKRKQILFSTILGNCSSCPANRPESATYSVHCQEIQAARKQGEISRGRFREKVIWPRLFASSFTPARTRAADVEMTHLHNAPERASLIALKDSAQLEIASMAMQTQHTATITVRGDPFLKPPKPSCNFFFVFLHKPSHQPNILQTSIQCHLTSS